MFERCPARSLLLSLLSVRYAVGAGGSAGVADTDGDDDDVILVSSAGVHQDGANMVTKGTSIWSAESCWRDGSTFAYGNCCCGSTAWRCWIQGRHPQGYGGGGSWTPRTCCIWQYGPGQMCLNGTRLSMHFDVVGLLGIHFGPRGHMCDTSSDRNARWLSETAFLPSVSEWLQKGSLRIADLGAGIGLESVIVARMGHRPVAFDIGACQVRMTRQNARANAVKFPVVQGDLRNTSSVAEALLQSGGKFDVVTAWGLNYLPVELFAVLLDLIDAVGAEDFVWPMECSRPPGDLSDAQRWTRGLAAARFELVDSAFFQNVGNPWTDMNLLGLTRVCFLQRRARGRTYSYPRMARVPPAGAEVLRRERGRRAAMYNQRPGDFEQMVRQTMGAAASEIEW